MAESDQTSPADNAYWRTNIKIVTFFLAIWAFVSFGLGILLRPLLSGISVGGTDLGFWFAQQGAIYVFLILIFVYAVVMNLVDKKFDVQED
ncbi:MAG: DUF4212 domain-containing protein [Pseudomonadota bacterium]